MEDFAAARRRPRFARRRPDPQDLVVATIAEHAESLLRVARRHTACQDDAEDAYQRALEIFVRSAHRLDPLTAHRWLHTVVKRESWAVAEARGRLVGVDAPTLEALDDGRCDTSVEERSERFEELARAAEALNRLKPQEVTALVLKAQGLSYAEIAQRQGWTYTKVNRCLSEGRKAFLARYRGIEAGEECARWLPVLSALADGEATAEQLVDARPHLRNCAACRAVLGDLQRATEPVAALLPPVVVLGGAAPPTGLLDRLGELVVGLQERAVAVHAAVETASAGKLAAVAASTVAVAGGGVAVDHAGAPDPIRAPSAHVEPARATDRPAAERTPRTTSPARSEREPARTPAPAPSERPRPAPRDEPDPEPAVREEFAPEAPAPEPQAPPADEFDPIAEAAAVTPRETSPEFDAGGASEFGG